MVSARPIFCEHDALDAACFARGFFVVTFPTLTLPAIRTCETATVCDDEIARPTIVFCMGHS